LSNQVIISITQKNKYLLDSLVNVYRGKIEVCSQKKEAFKYVIYRKDDIEELIDNYFSKYPLKTKKMKRINLIKQLYLVHPDIINGKKGEIEKEEG
jgi:hypothetical protein